MVKRLLPHLAIFILGLLFGISLGILLRNSHGEITLLRSNEEKYSFISPLLDCEPPAAYTNPKVKTARRVIERLVKDWQEKGNAEFISVYYRDLNNGPWFGIEEKKAFAPASLLKVPVMMIYLRQAESFPALLEQTITYTYPEDRYTSNSFLPGQDYTINQYLTAMIIRSDNASFDTLASNLDYTELQAIHRSLGIPLPEENTPEDFISVKEYANIFRTLYNASYLNREMSELGLEILSQTTFDKGIRAGVPQELTIANKYGVFDSQKLGRKQLHDCGIVYTESPYLLCVMTQGENYENLIAILEQISQKIYENLK